ncbi:hypothetical protein [Peribacillus frigoritolerans]|uniref:hypothetical protein n=1 Tax=Peribacillus frigoritolerans TaxID=450367 RepID=UPI0039A1ED09
MSYYIHGMMSCILIFSLNDDRFKGPVAAKKRPLSPINPVMFPVIKLKNQRKIGYV